MPIRISATTAAAAAALASLLGASTAAADGHCAVEQCQRQQEHLLLQVGGADRAAVQRHTSLAQGPMRWRASSVSSGDGQWCRAFAPADDFTLKKCAAETQHEVKVLTYNLYWWNLFGTHFRNGNGGSAGKLIASGAGGRGYDFMGFQECEDVGRVLRDGNLDTEYGSVVGDHAVAIAYRKSEWELIDHGMSEVAEDRPEQWWGTRGALWARFRHLKNGKTALFVNHHGPLPVGTGGRCGRRATAWNLLKTIATHSEEGDGIILVGDFNADAGTKTVTELESRLFHSYTGSSFGGVDHVFSNCDEVVSRRNLGSGGSDHDALEVVLKV